MFKDKEYKFFVTSKVFYLLKLIIILVALYFWFDKLILIFDKVVELRVYALIIILSLIAFSVYQKRSNGTKVENMSEHIENLESAKDAKRSSSNLTKQGNTNPLDE